MRSPTVSILYYLGFAVSLAEFTCAWVNIGLLPPSLNVMISVDCRKYILTLSVLFRLWLSRRSARPEEARVIGHLGLMGVVIGTWVLMGLALVPTESYVLGNFISSCAATGYRSFNCALHGSALVAFAPDLPRTGDAWSIAHVASLDAPAAGHSRLPPPPSAGLRLRSVGGR
ncbi:hypothetical protein FB451DRAFT_1179957 [Mycena latifolia]|nr:hypothetical protein FB451DRAFT_1179957 [Mycena latifolia]